MSGDVFRDGPPTTTLGGAFKYPSGDPPPSNEEISGWVKKEMAKGWQSQGWDNYDKKIDDEWHVLMSIVLVSIPVTLIDATLPTATRPSGKSPSGLESTG